MILAVADGLARALLGGSATKRKPDRIKHARLALSVPTGDGDDVAVRGDLDCLEALHVLGSQADDLHGQITISSL